MITGIGNFKLIPLLRCLVTLGIFRAAGGQHLLGNGSHFIFLRQFHPGHIVNFPVGNPQLLPVKHIQHPAAHQHRGQGNHRCQQKNPSGIFSPALVPVKVSGGECTIFRLVNLLVIQILHGVNHIFSLHTEIPSFSRYAASFFRSRCSRAINAPSLMPYRSAISLGESPNQYRRTNTI